MSVGVKCPKCGSNLVTKRFFIGAGEAFECTKCYKSWGSYYNRETRPSARYNESK